MAITLVTQPAANTLVPAYNPCRFLLDANALPAAGLCPVVYADVYFDDTYYATISLTDYDPLVVFIFSLHFYTFDIQDLLQEYLRSKFQRMYEQANSGKGDMESYDYFSCKVYVKFRETYVDTNGLTVAYGTAPVQATKTTAAVAGTGTVTSNTFYALNASLAHEDNPDLPTHLRTFQDSYQTTYGLSHRPNTIVSDNKIIGGGKYYVCQRDHDFIFCFAEDTTIPPNWLVGVVATYKDGTSATVSGVTYPAPTVTALQRKVYSFNVGIPRMRAMFTSINWNNVARYEVFVYNVFFQAMRQMYYVDNCGCCEERVRIFFLNALGTYDAINFEAKREVNKTASQPWQRTGPTAFETASKANHTGGRMQVQQNDFYTAQCKCYDERDMYWIKELLATPRAYVQWDGTQGQADGLLAIVIEDSEVQTLKVNDRYEYIVEIKYRMSNERITLS